MDIDKEIFDDADQEALPPEFDTMTAEDIQRRIRLLDNEIRVLKDDSTRLGLEQSGLKEKVKENKEKIKLNNQLPYLVSNIVEVLEVCALSGLVYSIWKSLPTSSSLRLSCLSYAWLQGGRMGLGGRIGVGQAVSPANFFKP